MRARTLVVVASILATFGGGVVPRMRAAFAADESDPLAAWDSEWKTSLAGTVAGHADLCLVWAERCPMSVASARFRILRVDPDHEATRTALGFVAAKDAAGAAVWNRTEAARDALRRLADASDAEADEFAAMLRKADVAAAAKLAVLGRTAQERADAGGGAAWTERARRAWDAALIWDRENEAANRALGRPKFEGRFCDPADVGFLRARAERKKSREKEIAAAARAVFVTQQDGSLFGAAGLVGTAIATPRLRMETTLDAQRALVLVSEVDAATRILLADFGPPEATADAIRFAPIYVLKNATEARTLLEKGAGRRAAELEPGIGTSGRVGVGAWFVVGDSRDEVAARAIDVLVRIAFGTSRGDAEPREAVAWIERGVADDLRSRLAAFAAPVSSSHGATMAKPSDSALELARRMVETDDDLPVAALATASAEERRSARWKAKARLFLQFLFERDAAKAREFVWTTKTGQPEEEEKRDAEYRRWVVGTF